MASHEMIVPETGFPFKLFLFEGGGGNYRRDLHWHRSVEIFAVCGGELEFRIDDKNWHLTAGEFLIVNSNEVHAVDAPLPNETVVLQIPVKAFEDYFTGEQFIWFSHEPGQRDDRFMELVRELYLVYDRKPYGYDMRMRSIFYHIMYDLVKDYRVTEMGEEFMRRNRNMTRLSAITSYMKENYTGDLSLEAVARVFGYSPAYLSRMFRRLAGVNFKDCVQGIRLEFARKDLESGRYSITETALRGGFSGSKAFARAFRKKYGILPSSYRELKRQEMGIKK